MKTHIPEETAPPYREPENYKTDKMNLIALGATADDDCHFLFHYADFRYAKRSANPALEGDAKAPPERLLLCFTTGEILILGSGLYYIEDEVQTGSLKSLKAGPSEHRCRVQSVTITLTKENV
jgi:hypothetical protein